MIILEVDDICKKCPAFEPMNDKDFLFAGGKVSDIRHHITCSKKRNCKRIIEKLKERKGLSLVAVPREELSEYYDLVDYLKEELDNGC